MSEAVKIIIAACGGAAVTGLFTLVQQAFQRRAERINKKTDKSDAVVKALMLTMYDRIQYLGEKYILRGEIDIDDRRRLNQMHEVYHDLGGNGDLDTLMRQVADLRLIKN